MAFVDPPHPANAPAGHGDTRGRAGERGQEPKIGSGGSGSGTSGRSGSRIGSRIGGTVIGGSEIGGSEITGTVIGGSPRSPPPEGSVVGGVPPSTAPTSPSDGTPGTVVGVLPGTVVPGA